MHIQLKQNSFCENVKNSKFDWLRDLKRSAPTYFVKASIQGTTFLKL